MRYSILFVIILVLVSGFIAYFGDILGRWMGKKRLTLWRLRPRHTAYAVTAVTGMLISALVASTLILVNSEFRKVFTEAESILAQNRSLTKENRYIARLNQGLRARSLRLQSEVQRQKTEVEKARAAVAKARAERDRQVQMVGQLMKDVRSRKQEIKAGKLQLAALRGDLAVLRTKSAASKLELEEKKKDLRSVQDRLKIAQNDLSGSENRLTDAITKLDSVRMTLAETNTKLAGSEHKLQEQEAALEEQKRQLKDQLALSKTLGMTALEFEKQKEGFRSQTYDLRSANLIVRQGDEVARAVISPSQSLFGIRADLFSMLETASSKTLKLGAGLGPNGRAVTLVFPQDTDVTKGLNESANVDRAAKAILQSPYDAMVQVVSAGNMIEGDQVPVELLLYYNKLVYAKGDKIASTKMDGRMSEGRILLSIINFLQDDVSKAGLQAGIVPIANPDSRANVGPNPRTQIEGLMTVVDQVKSKNSHVLVDAYACADVYAEGPLNMNNMRFSVAKAK